MKITPVYLIIIIFIFCLYSELPAQTFTDVAAQQGIVHTAPSFDTSGGGVSFYDFDDDGWDDLTLTRENDTIQFYRNNQGNFELLPVYIFIAGETKHALWFDYDNDSDKDLFVSIKNASCRLYRNDGNFIFTDVSVQAGFLNTAGPNYGVSVADYDKDGYLDLYLCRYSDALMSSSPLELNALYKNNGNGTFSNVATAAGVDDGIKNSFQAVWLDYDKDNWPDLYVINDKYDYYNSLYKNNTDGTFTDVTLQSGTADTIASPMTNSIADFDEDGDLDIFMTNLAVPDSCRLLVNNGNGTFTDKAALYGLQNSEFTWGACWFDAENDGDLDILVSSDITTQDPRNYLYINTGVQLFLEAPQNLQSNYVASSRSVAVGDIGNDGKADIIVSNTDGYLSFLWENNGPNINNYIKITLHGNTSNRMAIGSWIDIYFGSKHLTHYTLCGENYMGQNSQHQIFGLGQASLVDSIVIHFPSGVVDKYYQLAVNQSYDFTESDLDIINISYSSPLIFCSGDSVLLDAGNFDSFLWSTGANSRYLTVYQSGYYWVDVISSLGMLLHSDTLYIEVIPQPQISIYAEDISCSGMNDGSIYLDIVNQTNNYSITWNMGLMGDTILNLGAGDYAFNYSDEFGCTYTDSISIQSPYPMVVYTQVIGYSSSGPGSISVIVNGGTAPYEILLDGILQGNYIDSLLPGNYFFEAIDAQGCIFTSNIEIIDYTVTGGLMVGEDFCYIENPFKGYQVPLFCKNKIDEIGVFDILGNTLPFYTEHDKFFIKSEYKGLILLKIRIGDSVRFYKLVKE